MSPIFPAGPFQTVVIDPPWHYGTTNHRSSAGKHYATMTNDAIAALPIPALVAPSAHVYLWVTNPRLFGARNGKGPSPSEMLQGWGVEYKTMLTWVKTGAPGMGYYFRGDTEHVLFGTVGRAPIPPALRRSNTFTTPRGRHSEKPASFYDLVRAVSPGPRVDLFARREHEGFVGWGDQYPGIAV